MAQLVQVTVSATLDEKEGLTLQRYQKPQHSHPIHSKALLENKMMLFSYLIEASKDERRLITELLQAMDKDHICKLYPAPTKTIGDQRSKTLAILIKNNIIKKVKVREFIFNPNLVPPFTEYRQAIFDQWDSLP